MVQIRPMGCKNSKENNKSDGSNKSDGWQCCDFTGMKNKVD